MGGRTAALANAEFINWDSWVPPASVIGGFATGLAAGIAVIALLAAAAQIWIGQKASREAGALQSYRDYLRLCFENPEFSSSDMFQLSYPDQYTNYLAGVASKESEKYEWLMSIILNTCEEIMVNVSYKGDWRIALGKQISYHRRTMPILWAKIDKHFDQRLVTLYEEAIRSKQPSE